MSDNLGGLGLGIGLALASDTAVGGTPMPPPPITKVFGGIPGLNVLGQFTFGEPLNLELV